MKMSKADFELRYASIIEQWEAKRLDAGRDRGLVRGVHGAAYEPPF
jgi:hypothetical protein